MVLAEIIAAKAISKANVRARVENPALFTVQLLAFGKMAIVVQLQITP
jgi:hypothetical protein